MRQSAPISPAIHLGAERVVVIGASRVETAALRPGHSGSQHAYPSLAQIAGHAMSGIFLDALAGDVERLGRINRTLAELDPDGAGAQGLRRIEPLVIGPSQRLDALAAPHVRDLPRNIRVLLRLIGATDARGAALSSYLLFVPGYTRRLADLGRADAMARRDDVLAFFGDA
jgi:NTE family protein